MIHANKLLTCLSSSNRFQVHHFWQFNIPRKKQTETKIITKIKTLSSKKKILQKKYDTANNNCQKTKLRSYKPTIYSKGDNIEVGMKVESFSLIFKKKNNLVI